MTHLVHSSSGDVVADPSRPANGQPGQRGRSVIETGDLIARIFDLLEGSSLAPFAPHVASGLVNGARHQPLL